MVSYSQYGMRGAVPGMTPVGIGSAGAAPSTYGVPGMMPSGVPGTFPTQPPMGISSMGDPHSYMPATAYPGHTMPQMMPHSVQVPLGGMPMNNVGMPMSGFPMGAMPMGGMPPLMGGMPPPMGGMPPPMGGMQPYYAPYPAQHLYGYPAGYPTGYPMPYQYPGMAAPMASYVPPTAGVNAAGTLQSLPSLGQAPGGMPQPPVPAPQVPPAAAQAAPASQALPASAGYAALAAGGPQVFQPRMPLMASVSGLPAFYPLASPFPVTNPTSELPKGAVVRKEDDATRSEPLGPNRAKVKHVDIDWVVDFAARRIRGRVDLHMLPNGPLAEPLQVVLDCKGLEIQKVEHVRPLPPQPGQALPSYLLQPVRWALDDPEKDSDVFGRALRIFFEEPVVKIDMFVVRITYSTAPDSSALHWLTPEQTTSGKFPCLFSQSQAIHGRALIPLQDTPEAKCSSAWPCAKPDGVTDILGGRWARMIFKQAVPVPSYLIALVCGELASSVVSPRVTVWGEPDVLPKAAKEFEDTEQILNVAEGICGPYRFGICDLVILPPSFPYGGMENPCLIFLTPSLLAGDKSQVSVVAHEIAHSWSGNLVTNHTWADFFMNEGLTVYIENRIVEKMWGGEQHALKVAEAWQDLEGTINKLGHDHEFTKLCPCVDGVDPDDSFSNVPYDKGYAFFREIEKRLGGQERMESFLKVYFDAYAGRTISAKDFKAFVIEVMRLDPEASARLADLDFESWFSLPGLPPVRPSHDTGPVEAVQEEIAVWKSSMSSGKALPNVGVDKWPSVKQVLLLTSLLNADDFTGLEAARVCKEANDMYDFASKNCEIRCAYYLLSLKQATKFGGQMDAAMEAWLAEVIEGALWMARFYGRMKYVRVLYKAVYAVDAPRAVKQFLENRQKYHPICDKMVSKDLAVDEEPGPSNGVPADAADGAKPEAVGTPESQTPGRDGTEAPEVLDGVRGGLVARDGGLAQAAGDEAPPLEEA